MKAVLLAGGLGTRMREQTDIRPKPMVEVGGRPVLWHIMKWFAKAGVNDFVVLTGYKSEYIKQYFANYRVNNFDFEVQLGDPDSLHFMGTHDENSWKVTILDTGLDTPTGGRIKAAEDLLKEEPFFCTYGDGIATVDVKGLMDFHEASETLATVTVCRPPARFGKIQFTDSGRVTDFLEKPPSQSWVSIGYFVFQPGIFSILGTRTVLEQEAMRTLVDGGDLSAFKHEGFWQPMDTQREYERLEELWQSGSAPWRV